MLVESTRFSIIARFFFQK